MAAEKVEKLVNGNITNDKGEIMVKEADHRFQMPVLPCPFGGENTTHMIEPPAYKKSGGDQGSEVTVNAGFGAPYSTPLTAGGSYVQRADVNGMGYLATMFHFFAQCGGIMQFDQNVSNAIGGYPPGAVLAYLPDKDEIVTDGSNTQVAMFANELVYVKNIAKDGTGKGTVNANNIRQGKWTGWKICTLARRELFVLDGKKQDKGNFVTTDGAQSGISPTKGWTGKHTFTGGVDVNSKLALNASGEIDAKSAKSVKVPTPSGTNYSEHNADYAASIGWVRKFHEANDKEGSASGKERFVSNSIKAYSDGARHTVRADCFLIISVHGDDAGSGIPYLNIDGVNVQVGANYDYSGGGGHTRCLCLPCKAGTQLEIRNSTTWTDYGTIWTEIELVA